MPDSKPNWTVAVHLAGGKSLTEPMVRALQEMRDEANTKERRFRIVAQFEPQGKLPRAFTFNLDEAQFHFKLPFTLRRQAPLPPALASYEYVLDTSRAKVEHLTSLQLLAKFIETGKSATEHGPFMLVISGHGNGAVGPFLAYRDPGTELNLIDLPAVFHAAGICPKDKMDILGMDCCAMSMIEVGFELSPYARFLVASEGDVPQHGWPYRQILAAIHGMEPEEAAREIARQFVHFYFDYDLLGVSSHCAVCDMQNMDTLVEPIRRLAELLTAGIDDPAIWQPVVLAHWEAQSYKDEEYVDLADFCHRLCLYLPEAEVQSCCEDVMTAVAEVVIDSYVTGAKYQYSTGLSIYFPWSNDAAKGRGKEIQTTSDLEGYKMLKFSQRTKWGDFLDAYLDATQRKPAAVAEQSAISDVLPEEVRPARRVPPLGRGEESHSAGSKNHPTSSLVGVVRPGRVIPPFGKGGGSTFTSKKHPTSSLPEEVRPARRVPPLGRGGETTSASIKNHSCADAGAANPRQRH